jgi:hypothetical protein
MDYGHYNCRDYHISPHWAPTTFASEIPRPLAERHESFDELEERSRSPASQRPKFPLLKLPLELRQHIFRYLLPYTREFKDSGKLGEHIRNFSAVKKRVAKGMIIPSAPASSSSSSVSNVVWQRGNTKLLSVCKQLHDECAEMLYGGNTFLLFLTYNGISFRFRWLTPAGAAPMTSKNFVENLPERYRHLVKRIVVHVDHVDSYLSMIKFGVDGAGFTHGLRNQVQRLVDAVQPSNQPDRRLAKVYIRVSNGNAVLDGLKAYAGREQDGDIKISEDIEVILEPFGNLRGVQQVSVVGAVTATYAQTLEAQMTSERSEEEKLAQRHSACSSQARDTNAAAFANSGDARTTNLANLIRGF